MSTKTLTLFASAYVEAAIWTADDNGTPFDKLGYTIDHFAPETLDRVVEDCERFQRENAQLLEASCLTEEQQGHDFWLNRNGHGSGFWDEYTNSECAEAQACEQLSEACKAFGNTDLYIGDDGKVYLY